MPEWKNKLTSDQKVIIDNITEWMKIQLIEKNKPKPVVPEPLILLRITDGLWGKLGLWGKERN